MRGHLSARRVRRGALAVAIVGGGLGASSLASATGSGTSAAKAPPDNVKKVYIRGNQRPHFEGAKVVNTGQKLKVINQTDPRRIGPHTFSLVRPGVVPRTNNEKRTCFDNGHICKKIARWHGSNGRTPVTVNPVRVGRQGWDKAGNLRHRGDSFFAGNEGSRFKQKVSANGGTLRFLCAIHPDMKKRIEVQP